MSLGDMDGGEGLGGYKREVTKGVCMGERMGKKRKEKREGKRRDVDGDKEGVNGGGDRDRKRWGGDNDRKCKNGERAVEDYRSVCRRGDRGSVAGIGKMGGGKG